MFVIWPAKRQSQDSNPDLTPMSGLCMMDTPKSKREALRLEWRKPADLEGELRGEEL